MRLRAGLWFFLLLPACGGLGSGVCPDDDLDGLCDAEDPCPGDRNNDADGDGLCAQEDACLEGPDSEDADQDGLPDACDNCPGDVGNDLDNDGLCSLDDPCPEDPDNACGRTLFVALQVDAFPGEASWELKDSRLVELGAGSFSVAGEGAYYRVTAPSSDTLTLTLRDSEGDGGIRGFVWDRSGGVMVVEPFEADSYTRQRNFTFSVGAAPVPGPEGRPPQPEEAWLEDMPLCDLEVRTFTGGRPQEVSWTLSLRDRVVAEVDGTYNLADDTYVETLRDLPEGPYILEMSSLLTGSWRGSEVRVVASGATKASGSYVRTGDNDLPFILTCD